MRKAMWVSASIVIALLMAGCQDPPPPQVSSWCHQPDDQVQQEYVADYINGEDAIIFHVTSQNGLGGMRIVTEDGRWPAYAVLRLNQINDLRSFTIHSGQVTLSCVMQGDEIMMSRIYGTYRCQLSPEDCLFEMPIVRNHDSIDIMIPAELFRSGARTLEVGWIDSFEARPRPGDARIRQLAEDFQRLHELASPSLAGDGRQR